jgi:hypothetical protein
MTQVETNVIQAMANAGDVDQTLQNHVLKLVVAHDKAVANYNEIKPVIDLRKKVDQTEEKW